MFRHSTRLHIATALFLALVLLLPSRGAANCRCFKTPLDLVFVIDRSQSMIDEINEVRGKLESMIQLMKKHTSKLRVGVVTFEGTITKVDLTKDYDKIYAFLRKVRVYGGVELVDKGLETAIDDLNWNKGHRKVIILIGDEPPNNYRRYGRKINGKDRAYDMARKARQKGMIVHTVSTMQTHGSSVNMRNLTATQRAEYQRLVKEYRSFYRLRRINPAQYRVEYDKWRRKINSFIAKVSAAQSGGGGNAKGKGRKLPSYVKIAEITGGKAVALTNTKGLISWLMFFSTGVRYDLKTAKVTKGKNRRKSAIPGAFTIGQLYHSGDWNPPRDFPTLAGGLNQTLNLPIRNQPLKVTLSDDTLFKYPFLYLTGHKNFVYTSSERDRLVKHLTRGGFLFIDCCCGRPAFDKSVRRLLAQMFPQKSLKALAGQHSIYSNPYNVREITVTRTPMQNNYRRVSAYLEGITINGRLAVVYSPQCLGCGAANNSGGSTCGVKDRDAYQTLHNIIYYALTE